MACRGAAVRVRLAPLNFSFIAKNFIVIKFVISDYNWLDKDLSKGWFSELKSNYIIYDKFHRFEESNIVIRQKMLSECL